MKNIKIVVLLVLVFLIPKILIADDSAWYPIIPPEPPVKAIVEHLVSLQGLSKKDSTNLLRVMKCESGGNPKAYNGKDPNGGSRGLFQFQTATFERYSKEVGIKNPDIWDIQQQIQIASHMFKQKQQGQWSCYKLIDKV